MIPDRHKRTAAIVAICCGAGVGAYKGLPHYEGTRYTAYRDASPQKIWTICVGETQRPDGTPVQKGDTATEAECKARLAKRVGSDFVPGVEACIHRQMPLKVEVSFVDMAYNMGIYKFCHSGVAARWNAGDEHGACVAIADYIKSGGVVLKGLVSRRTDTDQICLEGLT